jgi:hypothetical protein
MPIPRYLANDGVLITRAGLVLGMSQEEIGRIIGVSRRTISRWVAAGGGLHMIASEATQLAAAVHPLEPKLAAEILEPHGLTVESVGIVKPTPPPPQPLHAPPPPPYLVDVVVCAAAEALDASPRAMRPALFAAMQRAKEAGLGVEDMLKGLKERGGSPERRGAKRTRK